MLPKDRDTLRRYFRGLRRRVARVFLAFGLGASLTWYYQETVFRWLLAPAGGLLSPSGLPIFIAPTEMLGMAIRVAMTGGAVVAFPVLVFEAYWALRPLMTSRRVRRIVGWTLLAAPALFLAGTAFAYWVLLPTGLKFLLSFGTGIAVPMIRISEYVDLVTAMFFWLGVVFELPLVMFLLSKLHLVSHRKFRKFRRYVPAAAFILSAILTPTFDIVNQTLFAVPIILLYEAGLVASWLAWRRP